MQVVKLQEDWQGVMLNSPLPPFMVFFEFRVRQCMQISDWPRVGKRQSNVN